MKADQRQLEPDVAAQLRATLLVEKLHRRYPWVVAAQDPVWIARFLRCGDEKSVFDVVDRYVRTHKKRLRISRVEQRRFDVVGRLNAAAAAIKHAKQQITSGAGNQLEALWLSRGNAGVRLEASRKLNPILPAAASSDFAQYVANDVAAVGVSGGGTCRHYAALVYKSLVGRVAAPVTRVSVLDADHAFVVIGDTYAEGDRTLVAADAWPTMAMPLRLSEHFSGGRQRLNTETMLVNRTLPVGKLNTLPPGIMLEAASEPTFDALLRRGDVELAPVGARHMGLVSYEYDD